MSMTATTKGGCTVNSGFMGETCPVCGADNYGGEGFCQTKEEREERLRRVATTSED